MTNRSRVTITLPALALLVLALASPFLHRRVEAQQPSTMFQAQMITFVKATSCPAGWTEYTAARGRMIVGLVASGTAQGTAGTALTNIENRAVGQHAHGVTQSAHGHTKTDPGHAHGSAARAVGVNADQISFSAIYLNGFGGVTGSHTTGMTVGSGSTGLTATNNSGTTASTNAPYIQLLACEKS